MANMTIPSKTRTAIPETMNRFEESVQVLARLHETHGQYEVPWQRMTVPHVPRGRALGRKRCEGRVDAVRHDYHAVFWD